MAGGGGILVRTKTQKMKKVPLTVLGVAVSLVLTLSCEKSSELNQTIKSEEPTLKAVISPSNDLNEFDYIGQTHNELLVSFIDSTRASGSTEHPTLYQNFYVEGLVDENTLTSILQQVNYNPENYTGIMDSLYSARPDLFEHYLSIRDVMNDSSSLEEKLANLRDYENGIDYTVLSDSDNLIIKATFSTARYSLYLWSEREEGGLGYGSTLNKKYIGGNKKTHDIVMSDIGGCYTSALFTWNPATAIAGGACSSAWTYLFYLD